MNKKIILSLSVIGIVAAIAIGGTVAYFSDTETSEGNTFTAGTIDISVVPWTQGYHYELKDMKPSQVDYTNFTINNTGTNPVNVWKKLENIVPDENGVNEPECVAYGGAWNGSSCNGGTIVNDIQNVIQYDLSTKLYNGAQLIAWGTVYNRNKTVGEITEPVFLGMIPAGWHMDVVESYHMEDDANNQYQSDGMTFNIVLFGEQLRGTLVLEDKTGDPDWMVKDNNINGTLTYGVKDSKFNYTFAGKAPKADTDYVLLSVVDPWPQTGSTQLATVHSDVSGDFLVSGNVELNKNLTNAKTWLVLSSDWNGTKMIGWHFADYLFETGLIDYYDADL